MKLSDDCCGGESEPCPLTPGPELMIRLGSPTTQYALAVRHHCPDCKKAVLEIVKTISVPQPNELWGDG